MQHFDDSADGFMLGPRYTEDCFVSNTVLDHPLAQEEGARFDFANNELSLVPSVSPWSSERPVPPLPKWVSRCGMSLGKDASSSIAGAVYPSSGSQEKSETEHA